MTSLLNNTRKPDITFYRSGRIDITASLAKQLQLKPGDVIDIAQDKEEYCIYVRTPAQLKVGRHEATVYSTNKGRRQHSNNFRTHSVRLAKIMFSLTDCAQEPLKLAAGMPTHDTAITIPLITRHPLL